MKAPCATHEEPRPYQADRIFDALVIAHEVGRLVERDFAPEKQIADLLNAAETGVTVMRLWNGTHHVRT
jgi:hypothetical protein